MARQATVSPDEPPRKSQMSSSPAPSVPAVPLRPWPQFADTAALSIPISFSDATYRINQNLRYFVGNYAPLELFAFDIDDRIVLGFLTLITLIALFVAGVWSNVFISVAIGAVLACLHAAMRAPEDQEASPYENLLSVVDSPTRGDYARV
nr:PRA1 family protein D-like [Ipomoea trifida]